ncbi:hypothetical protein ACWKTZ_21475 [Bacillus cereus]
MKANKLVTVISILIPIILISLIINFVYEVIPTTFQGLPIFLPLILCPVGITLALVSYKADKNIWSKIGIILNAVLLFTPFIWMIGGTILFGE